MTRHHRPLGAEGGFGLSQGDKAGTREAGAVWGRGMRWFTRTSLGTRGWGRATPPQAPQPLEEDPCQDRPPFTNSPATARHKALPAERLSSFLVPSLLADLHPRWTTHTPSLVGFDSPEPVTRDPFNTEVMPSTLADTVTTITGSSQPVVSRGTADNLIPVYCSILAAVVVGLVAYIAFKRYRQPRGVMAEGLGGGKQAVSPSSEVPQPELSPTREGRGPGGVAGRWSSRKSGS